MEKVFFPDAELRRETLTPGKVSRVIRAYGAHLMMVEVSFAAGGVGAEHAHTHEQATYCLAGEFRFQVQGESRVLRPGDSVFIPAGQPHGTVCISAGRLLDCFSPAREDFL
jgi:quercetin dioxygenase-like cupin family protein